jgi:hypothetical protein
MLRLKFCCIAIALSGLVADLARAQAPPATTQATSEPAIDLSLIPPPTLVSVKLDKLSGDAAIREFAKQTGMSVQPYYPGAFTRQGRLVPITMNVTERPFWEAFRDFCVAGGISPYWNFQYDRDLKVMLASQMGRNMMKSPASITGACAILIRQIEHTNNVDMVNPETIDRSLQVSLSVMIEPKIRILTAQRGAFITEARDENGNSLLRTDFPQSFGMETSNGIGFEAQAPLAYPKNNPGQQIALLKGYVQATLQSESERFVVDDPLKATQTSKQLGSRTATFKSLKSESEGNYVLMLSQSGMPGGANPTGDSIKLLDAQGRNYGINESSISNNGDVINRRLAFTNENGPKIGPPAKLIWEMPTGVSNVKIPFEYRDLPMP